MYANTQRLLLAIAVVVVAAGSLLVMSPKEPSSSAFVTLIAGLLAVGVAFGTDSAGRSTFETIRRTLREVRNGTLPSAPADSSPEVVRIFDEVERIFELLQHNDSTRVKAELEAARSELVKLRENSFTPRQKREMDHAARQAMVSLKELGAQVSEQVTLSERGGRTMREMAKVLQEISAHGAALADSAQESASAILEMTGTNEEMATHIGELGTNVRETVASIEQMTQSIKEVAKNVDALALTAEETNSSMNAMDLSIDHVQSNANETARLSEEVAHDAEQGAESILKTIGEIYRIKESSSDAVAAISTLGSRIDAIGQILNVIDEVAEQTNLLALNAAIIAAQAGEHGKGFAVVAEEIKELAERAGASTKEIAELIKTIQAESRNAIHAVERGAQNVERGVQVSNEAEHALKKILESSQKSTNMMRAIARATVEQAKGSKQVTDAIGRIAETVQQIAAATGEQARGSELIMSSSENMRTTSQLVERSSQEQSRGGRQISQTIDAISTRVQQLNASHRQQARDTEQALQAATSIEDVARRQAGTLRELSSSAERLISLGEKPD